MYSFRSATVAVSRSATSFTRLVGGSSARAGDVKSANARMRPMTKSLGGFRAALLLGCVALGTAGILYARFKEIPTWVALPILAAFLVEYSFYLLPAFPELRKQLSGPRLPVFVVVSFVLPYLACYAPLGQFQWINLVKLGALGLALALWYVALPVTVLTDLAFLAIV